MSQTRLAIVGGGPRAVYALESLTRQAMAAQTVPALIDVYEPRAELGTGTAYEPGQPDWVRLNLPAQSVDAGAVLTGGRISRSPLVDDLPSWAGGDELPGADHYPPRSEAGAYLTQLASTSIEALRPAQVTHRRHEVRSVVRTDSAFRVAHSDGAADYDAVLLATGHARAWPGRLPAALGDVCCLPALPVNTLMARAAELRPARVVVRGASLTAIDAVLALTEGLGGAFGGAGANAYRPGEPDVHVTLASRTGRLMDVKPESRLLRRYGVQAAVAPALATLEEDGDVVELWWAAAALILNRASRWWSPTSLAEHAAQVEHAIGALEAPTAPDPRERLATSLAQARGQAAPDAMWALGQAWRSVYPALVKHQQRIRTSMPEAPLGWPDYPRLAPELERLAFGPPPINAEKLIALMDAGRLRVVTAQPEEFNSVAAGADLVVDAVSAPPGVRGIDDPLWTQLLAEGLVTVAPYGRGILVDSAAGCLQPDGAVVAGLSAVGRMTEDVVLGNDTLTRTMHGELERWAQRVCAAQELVS